MKYYKLDFTRARWGSFPITEHDVKEVTDKSVIFEAGGHVLKDCQRHKFFATYEEANAEAVKYLTEKVRGLQDAMGRANKQLKALNEPDFNKYCETYNHD